MNNASKFTRGTVIAIWVFILLAFGSLYCVHNNIAQGVYFFYAMVVPVVFAIICEVAAKRSRNRERRRFSRAP